MFDDWSYQRGFEAAVLLRERGKSAAEAEDFIQGECSDLCDRHGFVRGYKNGLIHWGDGADGAVEIFTNLKEFLP